MNRVLFKTKLFDETRIFRREKGAAPGEWVLVRESDRIDKQTNDWVERTGHVIVACSPPGIYSLWLDADLTLRQMTVAVMVTYTESTYEQPTRIGHAYSPASPVSGQAADGDTGPGETRDAGEQPVDRGDAPDPDARTGPGDAAASSNTDSTAPAG